MSVNYDNRFDRSVPFNPRPKKLRPSPIDQKKELERVKKLQKEKK